MLHHVAAGAIPVLDESSLWDRLLMPIGTIGPSDARRAAAGVFGGGMRLRHILADLVPAAGGAAAVFASLSPTTSVHTFSDGPALNWLLPVIALVVVGPALLLALLLVGVNAFKRRRERQEVDANLKREKQCHE